MSRGNPIPLKAKYGKLRVLGEETVEGRRYAKVQCKCGAKKRVLTASLTSGRTKSCGAYECRVAGRDRLRPQKGYTPTGSRSIDHRTLRLIWNASTRKRNPMSVTELAARYGVANRNTLYSALRAVRLCGGIEKYLGKVKA